MTATTIQPFISESERSFSKDDWIQEYADATVQRTYEQSVIEAADDKGILDLVLLLRLLRDHQASLEELKQDLQCLGDQAMPLGHAAQVLRFLGY